MGDHQVDMDRIGNGSLDRPHGNLQNGWYWEPQRAGAQTQAAGSDLDRVASRRTNPPGDFDDATRTDSLNNTELGLVGHRGVEAPDFHKGKRPSPSDALVDLCDGHRGGNAAPRFRKEDVDSSQQHEEWAQPSMAVPDPIHRAIHSHSVTLIGTEELHAERARQCSTLIPKRHTEWRRSVARLVPRVYGLSDAGACSRGPHGARQIEIGSHSRVPLPAPRVDRGAAAAIARPAPGEVLAPGRETAPAGA